MYGGRCLTHEVSLEKRKVRKSKRKEGKEVQTLITQLICPLAETPSIEKSQLTANLGGKSKVEGILSSKEGLNESSTSAAHRIDSGNLGAGFYSGRKT